MPKAKATKGVKASKGKKASRREKTPEVVKASKGVYDITPGDLPHYTGGIVFGKDGVAECTNFTKDFPKYDHNDPRTHVMITRATLNAALGYDYTGEQVLPPYIAYPPKVMRDFLNHPSRRSKTATMGKYHRLYPHNCDPKGRLRKEFGMLAAELANHLNRYGDALKKQPTRATARACRKNEEQWRISEAAEERREREMVEVAMAEKAASIAEAEEREARPSRDDTPAREENDSAGDPSTEKDVGGAMDGVADNGKKRSAPDDESAEHCGVSAKRAKLTTAIEDSGKH